MSTGRISAAFSRKPVFVAYLTAGDPSLSATELYVWSLVEAGAGIIELGVPFSDPMADGPVNQRSAERALRQGVRLRDVLGLVKRLRAARVEIPLVLFTYFNPVFAMGIEKFASSARGSGVDAVLVLDLPPEEAEEYLAAMRSEGVDTVFLAAPTSGPERLSLVDSVSSGFVYYVSRTGVTGAQAELSDSLAEEISEVRRHVKNPIAVGFGISKPEHVRSVGSLADGVVVGSAIVKLIEETPDPRRASSEIKAFVGKLVAALPERS